MNRILLAAVAVLGLAGAAAAQDDLFLQGNYSASVLNGSSANGNGTAAQTPRHATAPTLVDRTPTASIGQERGRAAPAFVAPFAESQKNGF